MAEIKKFKGFTSPNNEGVTLEAVTVEDRDVQFIIHRDVMTKYYYGSRDPVENAELNRASIETACQRKIRPMAFAEGEISMGKGDFIGPFTVQE